MMLKRKMFWSVLSATAAVLLANAASAGDRDTVSLTLTSNGAAIAGSGSKGSIECVAYSSGVSIPTNDGGAATGKRKHAPIACTKKVDRASPLLFKALVGNEQIQGSFKFYRQGASGLEHVYTVEIGKGRVTSIKTLAGNPLGETNPAAATLEQVQFMFTTIKVIDVPTAIEAEDKWDTAT